MHFVVQQLEQDWAVLGDGEELARFDSQREALADVAARLEATPQPSATASLSLRYGEPKPAKG